MLSGVAREHQESNKIFFWLFAALCGTYFIVQCAFIAYASLSLDDFWLAYHIHHYKTGLPYRDFSPYKTVLGYYLFLPPMVLFHGVLSPLLYTKVWIAAINVLFLAITSLWIKKFFSSKAVLISVVIIITNPLFLLFSSEIRVDVLAYWLCLISVLSLFEKKYFLAGFTIGIGFLISQKAVWYIVATDVGLLGSFLINERTWKMIKNIMLFNTGALLMLSVYIIFWSFHSDFTTVLTSLFYEPYIIYGIDWYAPLREGYWSFIIHHSLEIIWIWPLAVIGLLLFPERIKHRVFILLYSTVVLFFIMTCKQPFIYFPLAAVPALFVLFTAFFSNLESYLLDSTSVSSNKGHPVNWLFFLPLLLIIIWSMARFINDLPLYDGRYQKSTVRLMAKLLEDGGQYIAGVPLLQNIEQPVPGLVHLLGPAIDYMSHPSEQLRSILGFSSMYLTPVTVPELIESIKKAPIKLYVDNDRFHYLPQSFHRYLSTQYQHFWGGIYLYAPEVAKGEQMITIKFEGNYKVKSTQDVFIDHKKKAPGSVLHLDQRDHQSNARGDYRLVLIPDDVKHFQEPQYRENAWRKFFY